MIEVAPSKIGTIDTVPSTRSDSAGSLLELRFDLLKVALIGRGLCVEGFGAADFGQTLARRGQLLNDWRLAAHASSTSMACVARNQGRLCGASIEHRSSLAMPLRCEILCSSLGWLLETRGIALAILEPLEISSTRHVPQRKLLLDVIGLPACRSIRDSAAGLQILACLARSPLPMRRSNHDTLGLNGVGSV